MPVRESQLSKTNEDVRALTEVVRALTARVGALETALTQTRQQLQELAPRTK